MTRVAVCALFATVLIFFILYSSMDHKNTSTVVRHSLGRRSGYKLPTFDPIIIKIERSEDQQSYTGHHHRHSDTLADEAGDPDEYFSDQGKLNMTLRLFVMFPMLDVSPKDGVVNFKELETWNTKLAMDRLNYRTEKVWSSQDKDGDGAISFREYLPHLTNDEIENNGMAHGEAGWWKEQFFNADFDTNGTLCFAELRDFLHPEDSENDAIQNWLLTEKIKRMDVDRDGKLNFEEFHIGAYDIYKNYLEFESVAANSPTCEDIFTQLDVNHDELLTVEELKPILPYLHPGELSYAKYYTSYLIHEADDNKDRVLTLNEMLNHESVFYSTVYEATRDDYDDEDDDDDFHDEL